MTTSGPEGPTGPVTAGPDAPTSPTGSGERATRRIARAVRGVLTDTRPLRTPAYRRLWGAGIVTVIGAQLSVVAVPAQIYQLTGSSAYVGLTGLFGLVPLVVFGLWGGAIADAVDRRTLLLVSGTGIALASLALWVTAASGVGGVWLVLALFAVQSGFLAVNQPARNAVIPRLLPVEQLPAANALNMTVFQTGAIAGPLLAGVLIPVLGLPTLYLLDAVALLATLWATWKLPPVPPAATTQRRRAGLREVAAGFRYAALHKVLLVSFLIDIVAMAFGMPRVVFPEIAHTVYGDPAEGGFALGLMFAAIPAGMVVAGLFSGLLHRVQRQGVAVTVAICTWGLGVALFGMTGSLLLAVLFLAVAGAGDAVSSVFRNSMLQSVATDEMRGRMQGVFIVVVAGGPRVADMWHGPAAEWWGAGVAASAGGFLVIVGAVVVVAVFP
ncbi:MAG TPA: MFS transporter, partial [Pseudonocardia sp.]|nr:MFS transporter [Pseudonocardia sp.]